MVENKWIRAFAVAATFAVVATLVSVWQFLEAGWFRAAYNDCQDVATTGVVLDDVILALQPSRRDVESALHRSNHQFSARGDEVYSAPLTFVFDKDQRLSGVRTGE